MVLGFEWCRGDARSPSDASARDGWDAAWSAVLVLIAIAMIAPFWSVDWFYSDENDGYVVRTVEFASELSRGVYYPRWAPDFYGGAGSPFFVFYAPLVYALSAWFSLWVGVYSALKLTMLVGALAAGLGSYWFVRGETGRDDAGMLGAMLYLSAPYRVLDLNGRGDIAEFLALGLLPVVLASYRAAARAPSSQGVIGFGAAAAALHTLMILSHTILALWGTGLTLITLLFTSAGLVRRRSYARVAVLITAFACALGLSSVYTVPALVEQPLVRTEAMGVGYYDFRNRWLLWRELMAPGRMDVRWMLGAALGLAALSSLLRRSRALPAVAWTLGAIGFVYATLPDSSPIWKSGLVPYAHYIQFPWRLLGLASLCAAFGAALGLGVLLPRGVSSRVVALGIGGLALVATMPNLALHPWAAVNVRDTEHKILVSGASSTGVDEYLPRAVRNIPQAPAASLVADADKASVLRATSEGTSHELLLETRRRSKVELNLHDFPGWRVSTEEGPSDAEKVASPAGLVSFRLPQPGRYRISVTFGSSPVRLVSALISMTTALVMIPLLAFTFRITSRVVSTRSRKARRAPDGLAGQR